VAPPTFTYGSDGPGYDDDPYPQVPVGAPGVSAWTPADPEEAPDGEVAVPERRAVSTAVRPAARPAVPAAWGSGKGGSVRLRLPRARTVLTLGLVMALVGGALAYLFVFSGREAAGSPLALSFAEGDVFRYRVDMMMEATASSGGETAPLDMSVGMVFSWDVLAVDTEGVAVVSFVIEEMSGTLNGQALGELPATTLRIRIAPDGRIIDAGSSGLSAGAGSGIFVPGTDQLTPLLPNGPVEVGDTWTKTFTQKVPFLDTGLTYESRSFLVRFEEEDGTRAAVIQSDITMPMDFTMDLREAAEYAGVGGLPDGANPTITFSGASSLRQTSWLDTEGGVLLRGLSQGTFDVTMSMDGFDEASAAFPGSDVSLAGSMDVNLERLDGRASAASPADQDRDAQATLRNALVAAKTLYADRATYKGLSPAMLAEIEPNVAFVTSPKASSEKVSVRVEGPKRLVLVTRSASGNVFCIADAIEGAGVTYGTANATAAADCSQGW
jgi:hypothetical protein